MLVSQAAMAANPQQLPHGLWFLTEVTTLSLRSPSPLGSRRSYFLGSEDASPSSIRATASSELAYGR